MGANSKIEWTHHTFNPWRGCVKISPACKNCYAESMSHRNPAVLGEWGRSSRRVTAAESYWRKPVQWNRRAETTGIRERVFCLSLGDVFEDRADLLPHRLRLWELIEATPALDWLLLTKRPEVMVRWADDHGWPENGWAGVTAENNDTYEERLDWLVKVPARIRFLSVEPLLGDIYMGLKANMPPMSLPWWPHTRRGHVQIKDLLHWIIVGGESGPSARPMRPEWVRSIRDQAVKAGVPFHFKQWGRFNEAGEPVGKKAAGRLLDGRTWDGLPT